MNSIAAQNCKLDQLEPDAGLSSRNHGALQPLNSTMLDASANDDGSVLDSSSDSDETEDDPAARDFSGNPLKVLDTDFELQIMHQILCQLDAEFNEAKQNKLNHLSAHLDQLKVPFKVEALMKGHDEYLRKKAAALQKCFKEYEEMKAAALRECDREREEGSSMEMVKCQQAFKSMKAWRLREAEEILNDKFTVYQWPSIARLMFMATGDRYCPECLKVKYENPNATVLCGQGHTTLPGSAGPEITLSAEQSKNGA